MLVPQLQVQNTCLIGDDGALLVSQMGLRKVPYILIWFQYHQLQLKIFDIFFYTLFVFFFYYYNKQRI